MTELEILKRARKTIAKMPYKFTKWHVCTCGHIYAASAGEWAPEEGASSRIARAAEKNRSLRRALEACLAHPDDSGGYSDLLMAVSFATQTHTELRLGKPLEHQVRLGALKLLDQAIARLERDACGEKRVHVAVGDQSRRTSGPNASRPRDELRVRT